MLSQTPSTIQRRRQLHRRQNSLEVPTLVTPLPASHRRHAHRRGLSLDTTTSTTSRPLSPLQEHHQLDTNIGQSEQSQHRSQETQQHRPAQPGHLQVDHQLQQVQNMYNQPPYQFMQMMQQQQMQQHSAGQVLAPPEQAIKHLQCQINAIMTDYPQYANMAQQCASPVMDMPQSMPVLQQMQTPVLVQLPNSPNPNGYWPTPPGTCKTAQAIRHVDAAPMPTNFNVPVVQIQQPMDGDMQLFQDSFGGSEYCSSSYQSSMVDPHSPAHSPMRPSMRTMSMPTLYEDDAGAGASQAMMAEHLLLSADRGHDHYQYYTDSPMRAPLSPREAMLANLEVDASIEDTGISAEEVQSFISEQNASDSKWTCLFPECGKKFGRKENIRSHVQTHLGDRQFRCNACGKCFVRQHDLKRHAKIHSGDKPHKCPCGNGFARQDALTRHRQRGVCEGALPGFERREVKRGRPRKNRPDMVDRVDKASRARALDARRGSDDNTYASSSSSQSPHSDPYTPPYVADSYDSENLGTLNEPEAALDAFLRSHQDTPPTSPLTAGASPRQEQETFESGSVSFDFAAVGANQTSSKRSVVGGAAQQSENFGDSVFDWGAIEPQPQLVQDAFSPAAASSSNGSDEDFDNDAFDSAFGSSKHGADPTFESLLGLGASEMYLPAGLSTSADVFASHMESWLSTEWTK